MNQLKNESVTEKSEALNGGNRQGFELDTHYKGI